MKTCFILTSQIVLGENYSWRLPKVKVGFGSDFLK